VSRGRGGALRSVSRSAPRSASGTTPRTAGLVVALLAAGGLTACGDLMAPADRVPTRVVFEEDVVTVTEGDVVDLRPYVVDQHGQRFDRLPVWADFSWTSTNKAVFDPVSVDWRAAGPGLARATASIAELSGRATVRVNPRVLEARRPRAYMVQAIQRLNGTVPMVAGRSATLRVFITGDVLNFFQPEAEVTFYRYGEELGRERAVLRGDAGIPRLLDQGLLPGSWTFEVPAAWVQPGLGYVVTADPDAILPLADREITRFPAEGVEPVDVRVVPDLDLVFVPIRQIRFGTTGTVGDPARWTQFLEDVFPIGGITRHVRETFHTDAIRDGGTDWMRIIQEIRALRTLDDDERYYYGVLRQNGGYAGLGYVGFPVAIGWDDLRVPEADPIPLAYSTFAHEMGHNFGRWHAPACGAGNADPAFPYVGGLSGVFGTHRSLGRITLPSDPDLMGYCRPRWVSDYTYEAVMDFRLEEEAPRRRARMEQPAGPGLMVWGAIVDGEVSLEPAIALDAARPEAEPVGAVARSGAGSVFVEGFDAAGARLFRQRAAAVEFDHGPEGSASFAAVVPLAEAEQARLHTIRVTGPGVREARRQGRFAGAPGEARALAAGRAPAFAARAAARGRPDEMVWDADRYPLVVVRDADTGRVLAFARQGQLSLPGPVERLRFDVSDGVRSVRARPEGR
jgi:hypothetical protein